MFFLKTVMSYSNKIVFFLLVLVILLPVSFTPKKAYAQSVDFAYIAKEYGADTVAWTLANRIVRRMVTQTVNWINSGFQGNPAYVRDPGQFFLNAADEAAGQFLTLNNLNQLCTPFRSRVRLALTQNYMQEGTTNYSCNLSILRNNYAQFMNDFQVGGWNGWFELTQIDSNNPYGSYLQAQNDLLNRVATKQNKYVQQLSQGRGFLSFQKCPDGQELDPALGTGDCRVEKKTVTPGSVIQDQINTSLSSGVNRVLQGDEISEIIGALLDQLINRVIGGVGNGLFGASEGGNSSYTSQVGVTDDEPHQDDEPPGYEIPPCPADQGYECAPPPQPGVCAPPPTDAQRAVAQAAMDYMIGRLNDPTNLALCPQVPAPASAECQQAAQDAVSATNAQWPEASALYYVGENTVGMPFTYVVGPNTNTVSNIIPPGDTWRGTFRVFDTSGCNNSGGPNNGNWEVVGTIDPGAVTIVAADPVALTWPETTQISGGNWQNAWSINFPAEETWPACTANASQGVDIQYTIWLFVNINGQWYGSAFERNFINDTNSGGPGNPYIQIPANWYYDSRWAPMYGHVLQPNEEIGFMVTNGNQRPTDGVQCGIGQRSNIVRVRLP